MIFQQQQLPDYIIPVQFKYPVWTPGYKFNRYEVYDFLFQAIVARQMNTVETLTVVQHEGGWNEPVLRNYAGEPAWGPMQLHVAAEDYRPGFELDRAIAKFNPCRGYVGDQFICHTGIHPSEPRGYKMAIEFGLDYAVEAGTWAAWYGAKFLPGGRFTRVQGRQRGFSQEALAFAGVD